MTQLLIRTCSAEFYNQWKYVMQIRLTNNTKNRFGSMSSSLLLFLFSKARFEPSVRFEPSSAKLEARTLPLICGVPSSLFTLSLDHKCHYEKLCYSLTGLVDKS